MADLKDYAARVTRLNVNRAKGSPSPHKPCLLLAVIDLIDDSETPTNRFYYAPPLLERDEGEGKVGLAVDQSGIQLLPEAADF